MPTYEFFCKKCKKPFEELCRIDEVSIIKCPICNSKQIERIFSAPWIMFKEPKGTSKEDNFDYVANWNMDNAKDLRRKAEKQAGGKNPYPDID